MVTIVHGKADVGVDIDNITMAIIMVREDIRHWIIGYWDFQPLDFGILDFDPLDFGLWYFGNNISVDSLLSLKFPQYTTTTMQFFCDFSNETWTKDATKCSKWHHGEFLEQKIFICCLDGLNMAANGTSQTIY